MGTTSSKPRKVSAKKKRKTWRSPTKKYPAIITIRSLRAYIEDQAKSIDTLKSRPAVSSSRKSWPKV